MLVCVPLDKVDETKIIGFIINLVEINNCFSKKV